MTFRLSFRSLSRILAVFSSGIVPVLSLCQTPYFEEIPFTYQNHHVKTSCILKDQKGWLFLGTDQGLFRYDGTAFEKIACLDSLNDESVSALFQSGDGKIWAGFRNGGIAVFQHKKFLKFNPQEGLPKAAITGFAETSGTTLWFATNGEGIYCMEGGLLYNFNMEDGLNDDFIHSIHVSRAKDVVLAGSDQGLNECAIAGGKKIVKNLEPESGFPDHFITSLTPDHGAFIVGTQDKGIFSLLASGGGLKIPGISTGWKSGMVNCVYRVGNELWIGTQEEGLLVADSGASMLKFQFKNTARFPHFHVKDIVEDLEGNVWLACADGLVKSPGKKIRYLEALNGEKISFVHAVCFDQTGNFWFTPDQGLVKMWKDAQGKWQSKKFILTPPEKLIDIVSLYEDPYGFLWVGTMGSGIFQVHIESGRVRKITENPDLINGSILTINGKNEDVWIGGFDGAFHCTIDLVLPDREEIKFNENRATAALKKSYIYCITPDRKGRVWFGTDSDGAYIFENDRMRNISTGKLDANTVYSILEDPSGNIWFNTQDRGIYKYSDTTFTNYSLHNGLSDVTISSMAADHSGNIVFVHKNGLDILDPVNNRFTYLKGPALLTNMNPDLNSISRSPSGMLFIGTEKFILQVSTRELMNRPAPMTSLESISVFQNEIMDTEQTFSSDQNNFTFAYSGLWYSNPSLVQFQYRMEGFNDKWINTTDREVNFPKLSPGTYTFRVRSSLNPDFSNASVAEYHFNINPPFWKTSWFQAVATLLAALLLYGFIHWRDRRIRKMDRLKKEAVEFQFETLKSQVNPHFLFNSFNTLISIIEEDQKTAVGYVEKLSEFFRSIVAYRDKELIPLHEEIHLLNNYLFLQKKRYGDYLRMDIKVADSVQVENQIPPLTLQLLVENAIKHNAISRESHLHIEIYPEAAKMIVRNNINPKMTAAKSSGLGLQNIINRFRLLSEAPVEVINDGQSFCVKIPLIHKR